MKKAILIAQLTCSFIFFSSISHGQVNHHIEKTSLSTNTILTLPFSEGWDLWNFDTNGWTTDGANWVINNQSGNPGPTAEFAWDPLLENSYFSALTSSPIDATLISEGDLFLDFDIQLTDRHSTAAEMMNVEVYNDSIWTTVATFSNTGSFLWESHRINISAYSLEKTFQIRFAATGESSFDILSWFIDNIEVYRTCESVSNVYAVECNVADILIAWDAPFPQPIAKWMQYDDGFNYDGIGGPATFSWAIKFDPDQIAPYAGASLTKIRLFNRTAVANELRIYSGTNAATLLHAQTLSGLPVEAWAEVALTSPIVIDVTKQLWITVYTADGANFPAGISHYSGEPNGDLITTDGTTWEHLDDLGLDGTWNLGAFVTTVTGVVASLPMEIPIDNYSINSSATLAISGGGTGVNNLLIENAPEDRSIVGFNIYRKLDWSDFEMYQFVPATDSMIHQSFTDTDVDHTYSNGYYYQVTCVWESALDYCESAPGLDVSGYNNYVGVYIPIGIQTFGEKEINLYPNPSNDQVTIDSPVAITQLSLLNYSGQVLFEQNLVAEKSATVDIKEYPSGIYFIKVRTLEGTTTQKLVLNRQ